MNHSAQTDVYKTGYDRTACDIGIVHLGFGAFHRAHQAVYVDDYMEETGDLRWGIAAVNLRAPESAAFAHNTADAPGYVVKSVSPGGEIALRQVRSHRHFVDWSKDRTAAEALLSRPSVHTVTITVTESGYYTDPTGALDADHPAIRAEADGGAPQTVFAYLAAALAARRAGTGAPLTIMCCDNIRQNGKMLRRTLLSYLTLLGHDDLVAWVQENVTFPCSMVDRITPRSTAALEKEITSLLGPQSGQPIMAEEFRQWVLQDSFAAAMPDLAKAGVTVTDDVDPYEETKIRILNGGHTCLVYLAALKGLETFDQAMADPDLAAHFDGYETTEVLPALTLVLPFSKAEYLASIGARFRNAAIADSVARITADGMAKFPIFIRPTMAGCLEQGHTPVYALRSAASWFVFARHVKAGRIPFDYLEPSWDLLSDMLDDPDCHAFTHSTQLWGDLPTRYAGFAEMLHTAIKEMEQSWPV